MVDRCYQLKLVAGQTVFIPTGTGNLLFYLYQRKKFDQEIVCESDPVGSGTFSWIRNYLFRILIQANMIKQINNEKSKFYLPVFFALIVQTIQWNVPLKS